MGLIARSFIVVLIAISTPLIYRQFANDRTVKLMSSYYSNYKSIDQFLRQSANHLDDFKDYVKVHLPTQDEIRKAVSDRIATYNKANENIDVKTKEPKETLVRCPREGETTRLWSKKELSKFDANSEELDIYLAFLGLVYNVTVNAQHYAHGADYNIFAGRDATRAFVTGNFTHDLTDDLSGLEKDMYSHLETWASFYNTSYPVLGRLEGSFYDLQGCRTKELERVYSTFEKLKQVKKERATQEKDLPECNSEWNSDIKKGRVWCSTKSGGIERDWVGVPRIYANGESTRCVCFNLDGERTPELSKYMSVYPDCDSNAFECTTAQ